MELLNGTENPIRGLDKNVWEYCIMADIIDTLTSQVIQLRFSPDTFDTELQRIQTDFDEYVKRLFFFKKFINTKSINRFKDAVKDTKNWIEIDKLNKYIEDYITKNEELINNCSKDENQEIPKIINHLKLLSSKNDLSTQHTARINELKNLFETIKKKTTNNYSTNLEICKKNKIIKDGNYKVVGKRIPLIKDTLYYRYDSKRGIVYLLGQYKETRIKYSENDPSFFIFEKDGKTDEINTDEEILIKEKEIYLTSPGTPGGKPRRTRRHKNKKRRSSRRKN